MGGEAASLEKDMYTGGRGIIAAIFAIYYSHVGKNMKHIKKALFNIMKLFYCELSYNDLLLNVD